MEHVKDGQSIKINILVLKDEDVDPSWLEMVMKNKEKRKFKVIGHSYKIRIRLCNDKTKADACIYLLGKDIRGLYDSLKMSLEGNTRYPDIPIIIVRCLKKGEEAVNEPSLRDMVKNKIVNTHKLCRCEVTNPYKTDGAWILSWITDKVCNKLLPMNPERPSNPERITKMDSKTFLDIRGEDTKNHYSAYLLDH